MSFQGLISGSECAVPSNPLSQVLKHTEGDRTLQQDRVAGPSSSSLHHLPGSAPAQTSERDAAMARQFFGNQQGHGEPSFMHPPQLYPAEASRLNGINRSSDLDAVWSKEQPQQIYHSGGPARWATEFGASGQMYMPSNSSTQISSAPLNNQGPSYAVPRSTFMNSTSMGSYGMSIGPSAFQNYDPGFQSATVGKGKGKEIDFDAAFDQAAAMLRPIGNETSRIVELDDTTTLEEALKEIQLDQSSESGTKSDFASAWEQLQTSEKPPAQEDMAKWEAEFNQLMAADREENDYDYGAAMQDAWANSHSGENGFVEEPVKFDEEGIPILSDYAFESSNKFLDGSTLVTSPLSEAKALLDRGGSLSEAALLLEAAIQKGELGEGGYEAWILLGETRNMDEREELGMRALAEGVKRAETANASGAGMISLAISYTNESYERASYVMLLRWLRARFPSHPIPETTQQAVASHSTWDSHEKITDAYLSLARQQYSQGIVDPDVQIALGILFYNTGEYTRAKDCFEAALSQRPEDWLLWNRLGSSLSNGNKPEEALGAYREALNLRPTYTRAIYNVGVACMNIGAHKEAAEHFLSALSMQETNGGGRTSEQLWFTLRRAFLAMNRSDLAEMAKPETHANLDAFRQQGMDF
ncbi:TPR-like protein [Coniophora puteana RWD-64-598 SS2]|uniref:TPR-like protein n=1 Tax=Coniophora puteana (strain RWD-64-598) TaxID=741705 RepID=A0A5M3MV99_CONPW|nr:TPR-like protein [Coniophora puteana RWD-64-598 SS2]EIW83053.1 TPR-like protein [Coniophora puteana RWD-64-598 SS2]